MKSRLRQSRSPTLTTNTHLARAILSYRITTLKMIVVVPYITQTALASQVTPHTPACGGTSSNNLSLLRGAMSWSVSDGPAVGLRSSQAGMVTPVIESELYSIFLIISTIFPAHLQPLFPLLPHLERHLLYVVLGPKASTVRYSGESQVIPTLVYKDCT